MSSLGRWKLDELPVPPFVLLFSSLLFIWIWTFISAAYGTTLRKVPGPFLAKFTRFWLAFQSTKGKAHTLYTELHDKYGPIVRVGPDKVSLANPELIPIIYGAGSKYFKAPFYDTFQATVDGEVVPNIFATRNVDWHRKARSTVAQAYSLSSLRQLEPLIDDCTRVFMQTMTDLASKGLTVDLGEWVQFYAFDVIGNITFSQTFKFVEERADKGKILDSIESADRYQAVVGQLPGLHSWLFGNERLINFLMLFPSVRDAHHVPKLIKMIEQAIETHNDAQTNSLAPKGDYLDFLLQAQKKDPDRMPDIELFSALFNNLFAGSDTTAMAFRAIFYFLVKNPEAYGKLQTEVDEVQREGKFGTFLEFQQANKMSYLQAVIKEALRLHPGVSIPLERVVPQGGVTLEGCYLPEGTCLGMNAWVVHLNKEFFGDDAESFRPERWLEATPEALKRMEGAFLSFGGGSRTCLGRHISMMELTKFVPQLLRQFELEWAGPEPEWQISAYFFAKQTGVKMKLIPRSESV